MNFFVPLVNPESVVSILSRIAIFAGLSDVQQHLILQRLEIAACKRGQFVFEKGDEPFYIYIVRSGAIELLLPDNEAVFEKKTLGVGECFGDVALISMQKHNISAMALEDSEIIGLSRRELHQLRHKDIQLFALLMMNIARELARRLQFTDDLLLESLHLRKPIKALSKISRP